MAAQRMFGLDWALGASLALERKRLVNYAPYAP
jgi:hypothetical protein